MAVYQFSALADGQAISFDASADRLNFDQTSVAAGDLTLSMEGGDLRVTVKSGAQTGKDVLLTGFALEQIAATNFTFADGSMVRVGDNNVGTAGDGANNFLSGGSGRDLLMGLGGNDNLQAGDNNDSVVGGAGNDAVSGNNGNDWLTGGTGNDTLNGGGGQDSFVLNEQGAANADLLADFSTGWDNIQLDAAALTQMGAEGRFASGDARFFAGTAAHDADDRIIYNSATRQIFYDADGNGSGAAQLLGTLGAGRTVAATDFWVFGTPAGGGGNVINGTAGNDTLTGTPDDDTINGFDGDDVLLGNGGADFISGGNGNDLLDAGPYRDPDTGMPVNDADTLDGGMGDDTYFVRPGAVILADPGGTDWVQAIGDWTLGAGLDNLRVGAHVDFDQANATGNELDNIIDGSGADHGGVYRGLGGNDTIFTAQRDGQIFGDEGDDVIDTREGNAGVQAFGGDGNDTFIAGFGGTGNGAGELTGGAGTDTFTFLSPANGGTIIDFGAGVEKIRLDATGMDALGASGNFAAGDGRFYAAAGATSGHDADDRVIYDTTTGNLYYDADGSGSGFSQLIVRVQSGGAPAALSATDIAVDNGTAPAGGQTINGTSGNDTLVGGAGNDTINGHGGNDQVEGAGGNDTVQGSGGQDTFVFREHGASNADLLPDFASNWDRIELDAAGFGAIGATGRFSSGDARFFVGTAAHDADDRIIFNSSTGQIFYDADGNGSGAAQLIATLGSGRFVTAADFTVIGTPSGGGNVINGTAGDDTLVGTAGDDTINGLAGNDSLRGMDGDDLVSGGDGNDTLFGGDDSHPNNGNAFADTLDGGAGDDHFFVRGSEVLVDSGGIDTVHTAVDWTLGAGFENVTLQGESYLTITGNDLANLIDNAARFQEGGTNVIFAGGGNDTVIGWGQAEIDGGTGDDVLFGANDNRLTGGSGNDSFVLGSGVSEGTPTVTITDFVSGVDKLHVEFDLGTQGNFAPNDPRFFAAAGANAGHDADDRIIYNTTTGQLWWDADGNGSGAAFVLAELSGAPSVVATDIFAVNGSAGGETINGTNGNDSLVGGPGNDTINGFAGDDTIDGAGGVDSMVGGSGNDLYFVDHPDDIIVEAENGGIDEVRSTAISYVLPDWVNNLTLLEPNASGHGNDIDNLIVGGTDTHNSLRGHGGNDTLIGNGGALGAAGDDFAGGEGNDSMVGGDRTTDVFYLLEDTTTSYGQDTIVAGGQDTDWGDVIFTDSEFGAAATTGIVVDLAAGTLTGGHAGSSAMLSGIESVHGTRFADRMVGNAAMNELDGGDGNDTLNGGAGFDRLSGGAGADWYVFSDAPGVANADNVVGFETGVDSILLDASVMTALGASGRFFPSDARFFAGTAAHDADDRVIWDGSSLWYDPDGTGSAAQQKITDLQTGTVTASDIIVDSGSSSGSTINGTEGDDTLNGTFGPDTINGFGGDDSLHGSDGADSLNGGAGNDTIDAWTSGADDGADTLDGGLGNDVYRVEFGDVILADAGGIDTVQSLNGSWTLAADLENLDLEDNRGIAADGTGNALNNVIRSATEGGTLFGLGGDDLLIARHAQNTVNLEGGDGNDTLQGGWNTDMNGGDGNDVLIVGGGVGADMIGGAGADHFQFSAPTTLAIVRDFASGTDKARFDGSQFAEIGASGNFSAGDARFFAGTAAHDADDRVIFDAGAGNLWYDGDGNGSGEAILVAQVTGNVVATDIEVINGTAGGGTINGTSGNDSLVGGDGNDTINGNAGNDTLRGMAGDDSLDGGSGTDLLDGGTGNDIYVVSSGDMLTDAGGIDLIYTPVSWSMGTGFENLEITGTGSATVSGNFMSNVMTGNDAANTFRARDGNDVLTGRGGNDFFDFTTAPSAANADTITDFVSGSDRLRFEDGAHAGIGSTGNWGAADGRFWASSTGAAHDATDRVLYNTSTGELYYDADGSGGGGAVLVATLQGAPTLSASDITVI